MNTKGDIIDSLGPLETLSPHLKIPQRNSDPRETKIGQGNRCLNTSELVQAPTIIQLKCVSKRLSDCVLRVFEGNPTPS